MWWLFRKRAKSKPSNVIVYLSPKQAKVFKDKEALKGLSLYEEKVEVLYREENRINASVRIRTFKAQLILSKDVRLKDVLTQSKKVKFGNVQYDDGHSASIVEIDTKNLLGVGCFKKTDNLPSSQRYVFETEFGNISGNVSGASGISRASRLAEIFIGLKNGSFGSRKYPVLLLNSNFILNHKVTD
jgi:hypothetical protein